MNNNEQQTEHSETSEDSGHRRHRTPRYPTYATYHAQPMADYGPGIYPGYGMDAPYEPALDILGLLRILYIKKLTIFLVLLFSGAAAWLYLSTATPIYEAKSTLELRMRRPRIMREDDAVINDLGRLSSTESFNTQLEKLNSRSMITQLHERLEPQAENQEPFTGRWEDEKALLGELELQLLRRTSLVEITVEHPDPAWATKVANTYATLAVNNALQSNKNASDSAVVWLQSKVKAYRKALNDADAKLLEFREANNIEALQSQRATAADALKAYNAELVRIETEASLTRDMLNALDSLGANFNNAGKLPTSVPRADTIRERITAMTEAISERDALLSRYTEKHPDVVAQRDRISVLRGQIEGEIVRAKQNARSDLELLDNQAATIRKKKEEQANLEVEWEKKIAKCRSQLTALERERSVCEMSYKSLLERMEEARLSADEQSATIDIVEPAFMPEKPQPVKPRKLMVLALTLILGTGAGVGLAFLTHRLEDRIWDPEDLDLMPGLKLLGLVPRTKTHSRNDLALSAHEDKFGIVAESIGGIRGILDSLDFGKDILITSSTAEEGKTIVANNLAIMSARSGQKTLLLDLDMRRPQIRHIWHAVDKNLSVLHALCDPEQPDFASLPHSTDIDNLDIIPSQPGQNLSPTEVLGSRRTRQLLAWARKYYDRVIVDSPPIGAASDPLVLGGLTDAVAVVCRANKTTKSALRASLMRLSDYGANILGVVINDVRFRKGRTPYKTAFGNYGYGYHAYGYGQRDA